MSKPNTMLWKAIKESGLKNIYIAQRLGVTPKFISELIGGRETASEEQAEALSVLLKVPVCSLDLQTSFSQSTYQGGIQ